MGTVDPNHPASILVVDDNADVREGLCDLLVAEGYTVREAADGAAALVELRSDGIPDVVLLDLRMPRMDGYEFLRLRAADESIRQVPVIVVSATTERTLLYPVSAVFRKPVNLDLLLRALRREVVKGYPDKALAPRS